MPSIQTRSLMPTPLISCIRARYCYQPKKVYYEVGVFGKYIFDKEYIVDAGNSGRNIGFPTFVGGTRSVIGVQAKIGF